MLMKNLFPFTLMKMSECIDEFKMCLMVPISLSCTVHEVFVFPSIITLSVGVHAPFTMVFIIGQTKQ